MYRRILVPLDGSSCSEAAIPHARALAEKFGSEIVLLRVVQPGVIPPVPPTDLGPWPPAAAVLPETEEALEKAAASYIEEVAARFGDLGIVVTDVEWGGAVDQIAHCAREHHVDLIVMGTHGRHGLERWLLGSTSESLLHQTDVPILLVKR